MAKRDRHTDKQTDKQTDRQTDEQTDRKTDRKENQAIKETDRIEMKGLENKKRKNEMK